MWGFASYVSYGYHTFLLAIIILTNYIPSSFIYYYVAKNSFRHTQLISLKCLTLNNIVWDTVIFEKIIYNKIFF